MRITELFLPQRCERDSSTSLLSFGTFCIQPGAFTLLSAFWFWHFVLNTRCISRRVVVVLWRPVEDPVNYFSSVRLTLFLLPSLAAAVQFTALYTITLRADKHTFTVHILSHQLPVIFVQLSWHFSLVRLIQLSKLSNSAYWKCPFSAWNPYSTFSRLPGHTLASNPSAWRFRFWRSGLSHLPLSLSCHKLIHVGPPLAFLFTHLSFFYIFVYFPRA